jgi:hypothetical protein
MSLRSGLALTGGHLLGDGSRRGVASVIATGGVGTMGGTVCCVCVGREAPFDGRWACCPWR